jgi:tetratricopeptide (TPR) repeat protein
MATAGELLKEAEQFLEQGQVDKAAELFEQAHQADKSQPNGALGMARVALLIGQLEEAMQILDAVLKRFPKNAEALTYRGVVDEGFGRIPAALGWYEKAAKADPKLAVARFNLGRALGLQGKWKEAVRELQVATRQEPNNISYWDDLGIAYKESGDLPHAVEAFSQCIDINPLYLNGYMTLADVLVAAGQFDMATQALENAKGLFPEEGMVHSKLAAMAVRKKDFAGAVAHLKDQTAVDPKNAEAWNALSVFAMMVPDFELAEQAAQKLVEVAPQDWRGYYNLGVIYDAVRLVDKAIEAFRKSIQNGANQWKPFNNLGNLLMEGKKDLDWKEAAAMFGRALEMCPVEEGFIPLYNLAMAYFKLGDMENSKKCATEAAQNGPPGDPVTEDAKRFLGNF